MEFVRLEPNAIISDLNFQEPEHETCVRECGGIQPSICPDDSGNFKVLNLLGELQTEYQKLIARLNLGIGDLYTFKWGNISGNILSQSDLINLLTEQNEATQNYLLKFLKRELENLSFDDIGKKATVYYGGDKDNLILSETKTFTTGDYEYIYVAIPQNNGVLSVNGIQGGFTYQGIIRINNSIFYLYKSDNKNLGETTITYAS